MTSFISAIIAAILSLLGLHHPLAYTPPDTALSTSSQVAAVANPFGSITTTSPNDNASTTAASASNSATSPSSDQAAPTQAVTGKALPSARFPSDNATTILAIPQYNTSDFVTQSELAAALASLSTSLLAELAATTTPAFPQYIAGNGNPDVPYAAANNIGQLSNVAISNATISGGSVPASSLTGDITSAINSAAGEIASLTGTELTYTAATTTDASSTDLYASNLSAAALAVSGTTTLENLNCATYGNGGKLTTDANGTVVCAADQGGSGSTVGGSDTQVQFNSGGSFDGSPSLTFASSTSLLTVTNASTTNFTASYASTTSFIAGSATSTNLFASLANVTTGIINSLSGNQLTYTAASTTNISASGEGFFTTASTTDLIVSNALSGFLQTNAQGLVSATSTLSASSLYGTLGIANGGTGTSTAPSYGQLLVGNGAGGYSLLATSSLGFSGGGVNSFSYLFPGNATTTGLSLLASTTIGSGGADGLAVNGNSTTTGSALFSGAVTLNGATTTAANGFNLTAGCFSVDGTCIVSGSGSSNLSTSSQNTWSALQLFAGGASTTNLSVFTNAYFGATATSSFNGAGQLTLANLANAVLGVNGSGQVVATSSVGVTNLTGVLPVGNGGTGSSTLSGILLGNGTSQVQTLAVGSGLVLSGGTLSTSGAGITALGPIGQTQTGGTQILATTTGSFNGLTAGLTIVGSGNTQTFTPTLSGTLNNAGLTHSSITINGTTFNLGDTNTITAASSTLLADSNTFSGLDDFTNASSDFSGTWQTYSPSHFQTAGTYLTGLGDYATTTSAAVSISTTTLSWNGLALGNTFAIAPGGITVTPTVSGTLSNSGLTNSTIKLNGSTLTLGDTNDTVSAASSTLLGDSNSFSGVDSFTNTSSNFAGTWQGLSPSGFATFSYPFPSNATSTALAFNSGLLSLASTTIGKGAQAGGLTINGGATTTGTAFFSSSVTLNGATTTGSDGINLTGGCFSVNGTCIGSSSGVTSLTAGTGLTGGIITTSGTIALDLTHANNWTGLQQFGTASTTLFSAYGPAYFGSTATSSFSTGGVLSLVSNGLAVGSNQLLVSGGNVGIGTTTPGSLLSVGTTNGINFSTATSTFNSTGGISLSSGCFAQNGTCLPSQVSQLLNTYTVASSSANISAGDIVSYNSGYVQRGVGVNSGIATAGTPVLLESTNSIFAPVTALSSSAIAVAYRGPSPNYYAYTVICTVSGTTPSCGTPVSLASVGSSYESITALSSSAIAVAYENTSNGSLYTVICAVSGTTPSCGTPAAAGPSPSYLSVTALSSSKIAVVYINSSNAYTVICTVSGTTPSCGTSVSLTFGSTSYTSVTALSSSAIAVAYAGSSNYPYTVICTVSGTTPSCGTPVSLASVSSGDTSITALGSSAIAVAYENTSNGNLYTVICAVSSTTPSCGTPAAAASVGSNYESITALSSSAIAVAYENTSNGNLYTVICAVSSTTPFCGTPVAAGSVGSDYTSVTALGSSAIAVVYENNSSGYPYVIVDTGITTSFTSTNFLGMATGAASANDSVTIASNGIVSGLSGLTAGTTYYWDAANGDLTTATSSYTLPVGFALTSSSILLNSNFQNTGALNDQFFGDAIFANNFRITEAPGSPEGLIFENQLGRQIATLDENGNWAVQGLLSAQGIASTTLQSLLATSTTQTTGYDFVGNFMQIVGERLQTLDLFGTATSSSAAATSTNIAASSTTPVDQFANDLLQSLLGQITQWFASAQNGIGQFFAQVGNFQQICLTQSSGQKVCVTGDQLATLLSQPAGASASISVSSSSTSDLANSANANTPNSTATNTAPIIQINGDNPAIVQVGATYNDLGATIIGPQADLHLGIQTFVDGVPISPVVIDTSSAATDTIDYVATDQSGLTSTTTRTVIIEAAHAAPIAPSDATASTTSPTDNASTTDAITTDDDAATTAQ